MNQQTDQQLIQLAESLGADHAALVATSELTFHASLRGYCQQNSCGRYQTSWAGPPAIGEVKDLEASARQFPLALVIQTVDPLEDSFDIDGMVAARNRHRKVFAEIRPAIHRFVGHQQTLDLSCGCCEICEDCTYPELPCRFPDQAVASVEAYGIDVNQMLVACGLKYNNGADTVSYVSAFFLPQSEQAGSSHPSEV